jgi:lactate permease
VLAAMVGRQLPLFALLLPSYVTMVTAGPASVRALWPALLVAGGSFALTQFVCSNFLNYALTDLLASLGSLVLTIALLRRWKPKADPRFQVSNTATMQGPLSVSTWRAWAPWIVVTAIVTVWSALSLPAVGETKVPWPGLHDAVSITLYRGERYHAIWDFQPLGTGTAIFVAALVTALLAKLRPLEFLECVIRTWLQMRLATLTVMFMLALAYLMNYSGMNYTLGLGVASAGLLFVLLAPFLGWIAVVLSGSDTAGNALFGNLQVVAPNQLSYNPVLFAATNASGGVMGKMISPQNIATGSSLAEFRGAEGVVFARTFPHSVVLTAALGVIVAVQQFVAPWIVPH